MHNNHTFTSSAREVTCWVPNCIKPSKRECKLFALPDNPKFKEMWLALAGKAITSQDEQICFCSEHFSVSFSQVPILK